MIYLGATLQPLLKGRGVFPDIMGQTQQGSPWSLAKGFRKFAAAGSCSCQVLSNGLNPAVLPDVGIVHWNPPSL